MTQNVWVAVYDHRHGQDIYVFATEEGAREKRLSIAKEWWDREIGDDHVKPENDDEFASLYFDIMAERDEWFSYAEHPVGP